VERREFIKHTAAIASLTAVSGIASTQMPNRILGAVLVDQRFSDSRRFAKVFEAHGAKVFTLDDDIARLWYDELRPLCAQKGMIITGLTLHSDLFISEQFARENGKILRPFGMHDCRGCSTLTHVLPENIALDLREDAAWSEEVARQLFDLREFGASSITLESNTTRSSDHPGSLFSWRIA
jgi:hypothetical protein